MYRPAEGQSRLRFGQLAGRSVFNTCTDYHPNSIGYYSSNRASPLPYPVRIFLASPWFLAEDRRDVGRTRFGNRARVVGLAWSPRMQTPSPTTKLLAGMSASEAAAERAGSRRWGRDGYGRVIYTVVYLGGKASPPPGARPLSHVQRFRARGSASRVRRVAGKSPPGGSLAGQSGLVFHVWPPQCVWVWLCLWVWCTPGSDRL